MFHVVGDILIMAVGFSIHTIGTILVKRKFIPEFGIDDYIRKTPYTFAMSALSFIAAAILIHDPWVQVFFPNEMGRQTMLFVAGIASPSLIKKITQASGVEK
jgi:hypothetical protein